MNTKPSTNIQVATSLQGTLVKGAAGSSIVVKTPASNMRQYAAINKRIAAGISGAALPTMVSKYSAHFL